MKSDNILISDTLFPTVDLHLSPKVPTQKNEGKNIAQVHDRLIQDCKVNESHRCNCLQVNPPQADGILRYVFVEKLRNFG